MSRVPRSVSGDLARLVELRRAIGTLRRALSPHREVIVALAHPELDLLSTESSAERFAAIEIRVTRQWTLRAKQRSRRAARSNSSSPESDSGRTTS
jgi:Mg2+ and Co2+ transporter CorA